MNVELLVVATAVVLTIMLTVVTFLLMRVARRNRSTAIRIGAAVIAVGALIISPGLFDATVSRLNTGTGPSYVSIDPGWGLKIAPAVIAAIIAAILVVRSRPRAPSARTQ